MATEQKFKTLHIKDGSVAEAIQELNLSADVRYFPIAVYPNGIGGTTVLLSQGLNTLNTRHPDSANVHFVKEANTETETFVLVDLSDTTNYPHLNSGALDMDNLSINIDTTSNSDFVIEVGFLNNVDGTDGQFIEIFRTSGKNSDGATVNSNGVYGSSTGLLTPAKWLSSDQLSFTEFANTNTLPSTLDTQSATVTPEDGDLVLRIVRGNIDDLSISVTLSYKSV